MSGCCGQVAWLSRNTATMLGWVEQHLFLLTPPDICKRVPGLFLIIRSCVSGNRHNSLKPSFQTRPWGGTFTHYLYTRQLWTMESWDLVHCLHPSGCWTSVLGSQSTHRESTEANHFVSAQRADFSNHPKFITALVCLQSLRTESIVNYLETPLSYKLVSIYASNR